ncbi:hypothetical protein [Endozoicomonas arenosclerae]|uniref:hypothetical protein n=1 Tax=Endozoicomonas arenosclerae TaxID=1633495 RepID=UPI0007866EF7|nr:hypothetical protein [Endozoicomonas arenosclerae]
MRWFDQISDSYPWAFFLSGILFVVGFLFGSGWGRTEYVVLFGSIGSFLGGIGTVTAVLFAKATYKDWRKQKAHDLKVESYYHAVYCGLTTIQATMPLRKITERANPVDFSNLEQRMKDRTLPEAVSNFELSMKRALLLGGRQTLIEPFNDFVVRWHRLEPQLKGYVESHNNTACDSQDKSAQAIKACHSDIERVVDSISKLYEEVSKYFEVLATK